MQLTPEFLPVGSIVEYNYNNEFGKMPVVIYGTYPPTPQKEPRLDGKWLVDIWVDGTTYITAPIDDISPIPLTEKILTDWCGAGKLSGKHDEFGIVFENDGVLLEFGEMLNDGRAVFYYNLPDTTLFKCIVSIHYLHELQLICAALKLALPIQIK